MALDLLPPALRRALLKLELPQKRRLSRGRPGTHSGLRRGLDDEFREHRPYAQGDDPKQVDWRATARAGHLLLRVRHGWQTRPLVLLLDASASMGFRGKFDLARTLAASAGYLALRGGDRVELFVLLEGRFTPVARIAPGPRAIAGLLAALTRLVPAGRSDLGAAASSLRLPARSGSIVLLSDLYGELERTASAVAAWVKGGSDVAVLQLLAAEEKGIAEGTRGLLDLENGQRAALDAATIAAHETAMEGFRQKARRLVRTAAADFVDAPAEAQAIDVLKAWLK
ncbi:MAG: DUF58 domain-containing protein [Thermoanaerobaculia bacterium]